MPAAWTASIIKVYSVISLFPFTISRAFKPEATLQVLLTEKVETISAVDNAVYTHQYPPKTVLYHRSLSWYIGIRLNELLPVILLEPLKFIFIREFHWIITVNANSEKPLNFPLSLQNLICYPDPRRLCTPERTAEFIVNVRKYNFQSTCMHLCVSLTNSRLATCVMFAKTIWSSQPSDSCSRKINGTQHGCGLAIMIILFFLNNHPYMSVHIASLKTRHSKDELIFETCYNGRKKNACNPLHENSHVTKYLEKKKSRMM